MKYSPFGTFSEFPAIFGNSQDESKFLILEWRRTYWWLLKNPPLPPSPQNPQTTDLRGGGYGGEGNGALMNSGSKPLAHAPMLLQSLSSAAIFP